MALTQEKTPASAKAGANFSKPIRPWLYIWRFQITTLPSGQQSGPTYPRTRSTFPWHRYLWLAWVTAAACAVIAVVVYSPAPEVGERVLKLLLLGAGGAGGLIALSHRSTRR